MNKIHSTIHRLHSPDAASLFIRIALGIVFINAGWFKLTHMDAVLQGFASMSIPAFLAYLVSYIEFIGGIFVILGLLVRYAGILLAVIMFFAYLLAHRPNGFSLAANGYEYVFVLFFAALAVVALGAGKYSLARLFKKS